MSATVRLTVYEDDVITDHDYIIDNLDTLQEAIELADGIAATTYSQTGVVPVYADGTPYWGESDENEVNQ